MYGSFSGNDATKYEIQNEENAIFALSNILNKTIFPWDLIIDTEFLFLAASPDGLINEDYGGNQMFHWFTTHGTRRKNIDKKKLKVVSWYMGNFD